MRNYFWLLTLLSLFSFSCSPEDPKANGPCPELGDFPYEGEAADLTPPLVTAESFTELGEIKKDDSFFVEFSEELNEDDIRNLKEDALLFIMPEEIFKSSDFQTDLDSPSINTTNRDSFLSYDFKASKIKEKTILNVTISQEVSAGSYILVVHKLIRDKAGNSLADKDTCLSKNYSFGPVSVLAKFSAALESPDPNDLKSIDPSATFTLNFSSPAKKDSLSRENVTIKKLDDSSSIELSNPFIFSENEQGVTKFSFSPKSTLKEKTSYVLNLSDSIESHDGLKLNPLNIEFTTGETDLQAPTITSDILAKEVADTGAVLQASLNDNSGKARLVAKVTGKSEIFTGQFAAVNAQVEITGLNPETSYEAQVYAEDIAGNKSEVKTTNFTTDKAMAKLRINEIMAAPNTSSIMPEYIEIINTSTEVSADLGTEDWSITIGTKNVSLKEDSAIIGPGKYLVIYYGNGQAVTNLNDSIKKQATELGAEEPLVISKTLSITNSSNYNVSLKKGELVKDLISPGLKPKSGFSHERINPNCPGDNTASWTLASSESELITSDAAKKNYGSPGFKNKGFSENCP